MDKIYTTSKKQPQSRMMKNVHASSGAEAVKRPRSSKKSKLDPWMIMVLGFGGFTFIVLFILFAFGMYILYTSSDRILPGVLVGETRIGNMTTEQATLRLEEEWNTNRSLLISDGIEHWQTSPVDFGLWLDTNSTVQQAYDIGRGADGLGEIFDILLKGKTSLMPEVLLAPETARSQLEFLATIIDEAPVEASIVYKDEDWQAVAGLDGLNVDIEESLLRFSAQKALIMTSEYFLLTTEIVHPQIENTEAALTQLKPQLEQPIKLQAYDPIWDETFNWTVSPQTYASWIRIELHQESPVFSIDSEALGQYFDQWESELGNERELQDFEDIEGLVDSWYVDERYMLTIRHKATTYRVQPGDSLTSLAWKNEMPYWLIVEANPQLESLELIMGTDLVIPSKNELLPYPVIRDKRIIISLTQQRMWTYENGQERSVYVISTGVEESPTLPGVYQIRTHDLEAYASVWDLYMPHFMGIYEGWPGFMNGIHGLPLLSSGVRLWGSVLGQPASFGCIILTLEDAENLYQWADKGVVVEIRK
ncbi:MAG: L,D-transpeptidase family protein [Anaerolineaceae bacterium]|nr:L,D-transpeptidase family protein [Anaerolineaceae bacterium]